MHEKDRKAYKGKLGEDYTCEMLIKHGYKIIARNYRKPCGEIDIIAVKGEFIAFVEVKTRKRNSLVSGVEAVNYKKKGKIIACADYYLAENGMDYQPRYDIAEVTVSDGENIRVVGFRYFKDAFDTTGFYTSF